MIAVIDEASPEGPGGIYYVVSAAVVLDAEAIDPELGRIFGDGRRRPFHWSREGSETLERMVDVICAAGVVAHVTVHYPTGRKRQEEARGLALAELVPLVVREGAEELIIESRTEREDGRDRRMLVGIVRELPSPLRYRWETKEQRLLWVADAVCGAVKEHLLGVNDVPLQRLQAAAVLGDLRYRSLP